MSPESTKPGPDEAVQTPAVILVAGWLMGPVFLLLAGAFVVTSARFSPPAAPTPAFDVGLLEPGGRTTGLTDPPTVTIGGFDQRCNACHKLFQSSWDGRRELTQHIHIELSHGINNQCDNCHARDDRERLVLHDGSGVPFTQTATLCAQCHGPVHRDWQRGTHGKTLGSWDPASPDANRMTCTECHDPHSPSYQPIQPLPGPNTLRMGDPAGRTGRHDDNRNPLLRWSNPVHEGGDH